MNIRVDLDTPIYDGREVVFRSPVDCSQITGLILYYPDNGNTSSKEFAFADAHGNNVGDIDHLFAENVVVKVIIDLETNMAFVQNADTNAYLERRFDELERKIGGGGSGSADGAVMYTAQELTPEQQAQARENIGAADKETVDRIKDTIGEAITLTSDDFVQGMLEVGTGLVSSKYNICTTEPVAVKVGDKITIKPNGKRISWSIESVNDFAEVVNHLDSGIVSSDAEFISQHNGYLFVMVNNNGQSITPSAYSCEITIGVSVFDEIEKQVAAVEEKANALEKSVDEMRYASPKHKPFTHIINDCQNASDWTITNTSADIPSVDTENFLIGTQSLRSDTQMRCTKNTYDMLNNDLIVKFRINSIGSGARLRLSVGRTSGQSTRAVFVLAQDTATATKSADWQEVAIPYSAVDISGELDFSAIDDLIFVGNGAIDWNLQYVGLRPRRLQKGIVTFTFDDCWKSQYKGVQILAEKGITSTLFTIKEGIGNDICLSLEQLQELVNRYGTDIEVHGASDYDTWTEDELKSHWGESQTYFKTNGLGDGKHMAYPGGIHPDNVVQLARGYFDSCRTINGLIPLETYPSADRYRIRAVSSIGGGLTVDKVKEYIDRAMESGAWLVLVLHRIGESDGSNDSMFCTENDLKAIADYAINSGAHIMNYAEVFDSGVLK